MKRLLFMLLLLVLLLPLLAGRSCVADAQTPAGPRRLLVTCPAGAKGQCAVELGVLRSDVPMGNVVGVLDSRGDEVAWQLSAAQDWVVFEAGDGERCEILIATNQVSPLPQAGEPVSGMLTKTTAGFGLRGGDADAREVWFSNRVARVAGAARQSQDTAAVDQSLAAHREALAALGVEGVTPADPYETEQGLVAGQPDFNVLLDELLAAELEARAEDFVVARSNLASQRAERSHVDMATIAPLRMKHGEGAASLSGRLHLKQAERLTFHIYSVFGGVLRIDGRAVALIRPAKKAVPEGWRRRVSLTLAAGAHDIELITQGKRAGYEAGLMWVPPGENVERHMRSNDFAPAPRATVTRFVSADHARDHALVLVTQLGHTGRFEKARYWARLESLSGILPWRVGDHESRGEQLNLCVPAGAAVETGLEDERFSITLGEEHSHYLGGSLAVLADVPPFLYRQERLKGRATLVAEGDIPLAIELQMQRIREGKLVESLLSEQVELPGCRADPPQAPLSGASVQDIELVGRRMRSGDALEFSAACGQEQFADETYRVTAPAESVGVTCGADGALRNVDGERVLMMLSRPTLSDRRNWGLVRGMLAARDPDNLLVVAGIDEWGGAAFRAAVAEAGRQRGMQVTMIDWQGMPSGVSRMFGSIGTVATALQEQDYDGVLLLPSLADMAAGTSVREMTRTLACLTEMSCGKVGRHRVWLALPPAYRAEVPRSAAFEEGLLRVAGDYGTGAVPLARWLETKATELAGAYEEEGIVQPGPVGLRDLVAKTIIAWICGDES